MTAMDDGLSGLLANNELDDAQKQALARAASPRSADDPLPRGGLLALVLRHLPAAILEGPESPSLPPSFHERVKAIEGRLEDDPDSLPFSLRELALFNMLKAASSPSSASPSSASPSSASPASPASRSRRARARAAFSAAALSSLSFTFDPLAVHALNLYLQHPRHSLPPSLSAVLVPSLLTTSLSHELPFPGHYKSLHLSQLLSLKTFLAPQAEDDVLLLPLSEEPHLSPSVHSPLFPIASLAYLYEDTGRFSELFSLASSSTDLFSTPSSYLDSMIHGYYSSYACVELRGHASLAAFGRPGENRSPSRLSTALKLWDEAFLGPLLYQGKGSGILPQTSFKEAVGSSLFGMFSSPPPEEEEKDLRVDQPPLTPLFFVYSYLQLLRLTLCGVVAAGDHRWSELGAAMEAHLDVVRSDATASLALVGTLGSKKAAELNVCVSPADSSYGEALGGVRDLQLAGAEPTVEVDTTAAATALFPLGRGLDLPRWTQNPRARVLSDVLPLYLLVNSNESEHQHLALVLARGSVSTRASVAAYERLSAVSEKLGRGVDAEDAMTWAITMGRNDGGNH
ncbi:hypothetical protein TeGR_g3070 [Tetraparma gracilis]|uniref:Uncharacterized protein n=1 Tax=Tetraparma gracilis TaxID=2962635 RepID=A0ABQ6N4D1_9STRA|nr:hypothetical protein TeGR_g3070 [Tetraparma gracilis]